MRNRQLQATLSRPTCHSTTSNDTTTYSTASNSTRFNGTTSNATKTLVEMKQLNINKECMFPHVDPFDPNILKISGLQKDTLNCDKHPMPEITYIDGLSIQVDPAISGSNSSNIECRYRNITRPPYQDNDVAFSKWSQSFTHYINITDEHEFLDVRCFDRSKKDKVVSNAFYSLVPKKTHLKTLFEAAYNKRLQEFNPKETLKIIAVGLDGLPRHQMLRGMSKTYKHLTEELKSFDFTLHSQTGNNTFPNFLSLLSAYTLDEVSKWWDIAVPEDVFDLIWKDFEKSGYRTLYTEDNPRAGAFYWDMKRFLNPQTTYFNRPLQLAMGMEPGFLWKNRLCVGRHSISEYHLDYLTRFLDTFSREPVACMTMINDVTHNDITNAKIIDDHIVKFYKALKSKGHLNNSVVIFFSDHGARWGGIRKTYNGLVESRNPFLILTFPPWFLKKYPDIERNLRTNTRRLTSHFDTRQTLLDLLYFKALEPIPLYRGKHGLSLFREIPANRTCTEASIPDDECLCGYKVERYLNVTSQEALTLAQALLSAVTQKSDPKKCKEYRLKEVLQVGAFAQPKVLREVKGRHLACSVRLSVDPGGAIFEGTVTLDPKTNTTVVGNNIERLNMYRGEVECRPTSREQMFCYCKGNKM
ncbi:hypothetical protein ElyMa_001570000 [Elysia marginata]|uniref:Sulfatase N-terminal domain-containing protein n=1 Tax=Elysia marginata TaxID=1093978 RepID=A0AAV4JIJ6_9GAST|nr:hypothetical protein ElyMa_001570000 [Elysia marginata]